MSPLHLNGAARLTQVMMMMMVALNFNIGRHQIICQDVSIISAQQADNLLAKREKATSARLFVSKF